MSDAQRRPHPQPRTSPELGLRARKDGAVIAIVRVVQHGNGYVAQASVARDGQPHTAGPYHLATAAEAMAFVAETSEALTYLGCDVEAA